MSYTQPSRRDEEKRPERRGLGLFRWLDWGWKISLLVAAAIVALVVYGLIRINPEVNPPPAGYAQAACGAFGHLAAGVEILAAADGDGASVQPAIDAEIAAASEDVARLPAWPPGEAFEGLLASLIVTLVESTGVVEPDEGGFLQPEEVTPEQRLDVASNLVAEGRETLEEERLGFACAS